jgi:ubiquinone/menaquinone biosynthesis C-methylase UbiE
MATGETEIPIDHDGADSAIGDAESSRESDTTSLASSIYKYRFENGRRYHAYKEGEYWGPNDEKHNDQLDIGHHMFLLILDDKLFLSPISKNPQSVLDVGTGTGIWAIDFADQHPSAEVIGIDLSPTQPSFVPPNCRFEVCDATESWTFQRDKFDFVHIRALLGSIADWPGLYSEIFTHLKPGGWLEQLEVSVEVFSDDGTVVPGHPFDTWGKTFVKAGIEFGKTLKIVDEAKDWVEQAGYENVTQVIHKVPIGPWSSDKKLKEIGRWNQLWWNEGLEGWGLFLLTRILKWEYAEAQTLFGQMRTAFRDRKVHGYMKVMVVYAQKPQAK